MKRSPYVSRESLLKAIKDYETNLANFASGKIKPRSGEEAANLIELERRKQQLVKINAKESK